MHIRLGRIAVAVTVHRQVVHDTDIDHVPLHMIADRLGRLRHGLQKIILGPPGPAAVTGAAGVDQQFSVLGGNTDRDIFQRPTKSSHGVALKM